MRSMPHNFSSFSEYIECLKHRWSLIGVTETWLNKDNHDMYNLPAYRFVNRYRTNRSGGGVGLFLPENIEFTVRTDLSVFDDTLETLFIEMKLNAMQNVIIGVVYRPPGGRIQDFNEAFTNILDTIKFEKKLCYLLGDWNINLLSYDKHNHTAAFIDMLYSYVFLP